MSKAISAIFENGIFRPLEKITFPEHQKVKLVIEVDEIPTKLIADAAEKGKSFNFLKNHREEIYTIKDGEQI